METAVTVTRWNPLVPACTGSYLLILARTSLQEPIAKFSGIMRAYYESIGSMKLPFLEYLPHGNWQMPQIRLFEFFLFVFRGPLQLCDGQVIYPSELPFLHP